MGEVCAAAGYNRATFYLHFHDLHEMLELIEADLLERTAACVESCMKRLEKDSGKLSCIAACTDVVVFYERNKAYLSVLLSDEGDPAFVHALKERLKPLWRLYVVQDGGGRSEGEIDLLLEYTLAGTLFMIARWLSNPGSATARQLAHLIYDFSIKDVRRRAE